jgi:hypothetical protein
MFLVEVTWGERVKLAIDRWETPARKRTALFSAVAEITGAKSPNTIAKLQRSLEAPRTLNDRIRATVLLLALDLPLGDYELSEDVLPRGITPETIGRALASHSATCLNASPIAA